MRTFVYSTPRLLRSILTLSLAVGTMAGCHTGRSVAREPAGDPYLILAKELETSSQSNLYDAVRQLRPAWFSRLSARRGSGEQSIRVYLDERLQGAPSSLARIPMSVVARISYIGATEAQLKFGQQNGMYAAILVETDRR